MSGKGDTRRPADVSDDELDDNWRRTFGKKRKPRESAEAAARRIGQLELLGRNE